MKFDLSKIMKRAWEIKKCEDRKIKNSKWNHNDFSELKESEKTVFGICLQMAWEEVKETANTIVNTNVATIKDWFLNKKFGSEVSNFSDKIEIEKETEKAVFGKVGCTYGTSVSYMEIWCPKSCLC